MEVPAEDFECGICREPLNRHVSLSDGSVVDFCCLKRWENSCSENKGKTPLTLMHIGAVKFKSMSLARVLCEKCPEKSELALYEEKRWTAELFMAVSSANSKAVVRAIANGADLNLLPNWAILGLMKSEYPECRDEVLELLLLNGMDPCTFFSDYTSIRFILRAMIKAEKIKLFLDHGLDPMHFNGWMLQYICDTLVDFRTLDLFLRYTGEGVEKRPWTFIRLFMRGNIEEMKNFVGSNTSIQYFVPTEFEDRFDSIFTLTKHTDEFFEFFCTHFLSADASGAIKLFMKACRSLDLAKMRIMANTVPLHLTTDDERNLVGNFLYLEINRVSTEAMRILVEIGVDVAKRGEEVLRAFGRHVFLAGLISQCLHLLLDFGLDVNFDNGFLINCLSDEKPAGIVHAILTHPDVDLSLATYETLLNMASAKTPALFSFFIKRASIPLALLHRLLENKDQMSKESVALIEQRIALLCTSES
jgi:hypothetical protein